MNIACRRFTVRASLIAVLALSPLAADLTTRAAEPQAAGTAGAVSEPDERTLQFNFRFQPWEKVLDWFAQEADLSLNIDTVPPGTLNYSDSRRYTPAEAIDLMNEVLLTKGYTLLRRRRMLMVINLEDGIPPNLVPIVSLEELDRRGAHELVSVLFALKKMTPEEAKKEITPLSGPQGSIVVLTKARQIQVTETAGRLRTIRSVIDSIEKDTGSDGVMPLNLEYISAEAALPVIRQLLGLAEGSNVAADGSLRIAVDPAGEMLLASGNRDVLRRLDEIVQVIDVPGPAGAPSSAIAEVPQLQVHSIASADPAFVLKVLQSLLAGDPGIRLETNPVTGNLVAYARPSQQATIRATIDQMQQDSRRFEVIQLNTLDPQTAVAAIKSLYGATGDTADPNAPKVDADATSRRLFIRGTGAQVAQIRGLLSKMGESGAATGVVQSRGNVRILRLPNQAARAALEQLQQVWPGVRQNKIQIRVSTPASTIPSFRPGGSSSSDRLRPDDARNFRPPAQPARQIRRSSSEPSRQPRRPVNENTPRVTTNPSASGSGVPVLLAFYQEQEIDDADQTQVETTERAPESPSGPLAPIFVAPGPAGTIIASEDVAALDQFEALLNAIAGRVGGGPEYAVYYLKYAKASVVAETVGRIFAGRATSTASGTGAAGGLLGSTTPTSGSLDIIADPRLNALFVEGNPADFDTLEQILKILDQQTSPEDVQITAQPKLIPVYNTSAEEVAAVVRQVYQDRLMSANSGRAQSPADFFRAFRGGDRGGFGGDRGSRGGRGGGSRQQQRRNGETEVTQMSIGVDARSNSLVVLAPQPLFREVEVLVARLDQATTEVNETMRVITLNQSNPQAVQQALAAILGESLTSTTNSTNRANSRTQNRSNGRGGSANGVNNRRDFFRQFLQQDGGGRGGPGGGGRGGRDGGGGNDRGGGGRRGGGR